MLNLLRELGNTLPTPLIAYNEKGEIVYANPACQEMTEEISEEIVGKSIFDFIHPEDWEKVKDAMKRRLAGEKGEPNSLRLKD